MCRRCLNRGSSKRVAAVLVVVLFAVTLVGVVIERVFAWSDSDSIALSFSVKPSIHVASVQVSPSSPKWGEKVRVTISVRNEGPTATGYFQVKIYDDGFPSDPSGKIRVVRSDGAHCYPLKRGQLVWSAYYKGQRIRLKYPAYECELRNWARGRTATITFEIDTQYLSGPRLRFYVKAAAVAGGTADFPDSYRGPGTTQRDPDQREPALYVNVPLRVAVDMEVEPSRADSPTFDVRLVILNYNYAPVTLQYIEIKPNSGGVDANVISGVKVNGRTLSSYKYTISDRGSYVVIEFRDTASIGGRSVKGLAIPARGTIVVEFRIQVQGNPPPGSKLTVTAEGWP